MKQCKTCGQVYEGEKTCPCPPRGGNRKGAGKPALFGSPMKRVNVMLDKKTIKALKALGKGNLSEGIRKAALIIP